MGAKQSSCFAPANSADLKNNLMKEGDSHEYWKNKVAIHRFAICIS